MAGRGRGSTLPAWMTDPKPAAAATAAAAPVPPPPASAPGQFDDSKEEKAVLETLVVEAGVDLAVETEGQGVVTVHDLDREAETVIVGEEVVAQETKAVIGTVAAEVTGIGIGVGSLVIGDQSMSLNMTGNLEVKAVGLVISM